jgi:hypothetical protein
MRWRGLQHGSANRSGMNVAWGIRLRLLLLLLPSGRSLCLWLLLRL